MSHEYLNQVIGRQLSAVCFVQDYQQFQFDGLTFTVLTPVTIESATARTNSGEDQYRNRVCEQITKVVREVHFSDGEAIWIVFEDSSSLRFSLAAADYCGPEAVIYNGYDRMLAVF